MCAYVSIYQLCNLTGVLLQFWRMASVTHFAISSMYYVNFGLWLQLSVLQFHSCIIAILAYGFSYPLCNLTAGVWLHDPPF